ncbi:MAG: RibD family protein [Waterburya sp.]
MNQRLHTTAILAMTADGKIADFQHSSARFGSANDKTHLENQISLVDGVLFGATTLRSYGTTLSVSNPVLLQERIKRSQQPQPVQIVVSASGDLDPEWRFFQQAIPRWLLTVPSGAEKWRSQPGFERILILHDNKENNGTINWAATFNQFPELSLNKLAILGGGELVASLLAVDLIDELWLTICPLIFGGNAPTPVGGTGFLQSQAKKLELLETKQVEQEVFLHYLIKK